MRIVYLGPYHGTSAHRVGALRRLGHEVHVIDPRLTLSPSRWIDGWIRHTGAVFLEGLVSTRVLAGLPAGRWDLAYVDGGILVGPVLVRALKHRCGHVVNYNLDDPFGSRDLRTWRLYRKAVPDYDGLIVVRDVNVEEARYYAAKHVLRVFLSADEVAHSPITLSSEEIAAWASEVLFAGTWMPERGPLMARLLELGVPLTIYGNRWHKAPEWPALRTAWRGPGLSAGESYRKAILGSKICLGLVSKGNRDQSTTRSSEIPLLGRVLCAQRTPEHESMYRDAAEAEFWTTPEECAEKCHLLLADSKRRERVAAAGHRRCLQNGTLNERVLGDILAWVAGLSRANETVQAGCR